MLRSSKDRSGRFSTCPAQRKIIPGHFALCYPSAFTDLGLFWQAEAVPAPVVHRSTHPGLCIQESLVFHVLLLENKQFQELHESQPAFLQPSDLWWNLWCLIKFCSSEALGMVGEFIKILFPLGAH